jgi:atypical dual specificity phosphatase
MTAAANEHEQREEKSTDQDPEKGPPGLSFIAPGVAGSAAPGSHPSNVSRDARVLRRDFGIKFILSLCEGLVETDLLYEGGIEQHRQVDMKDYCGLGPPELMECVSFLRRGAAQGGVLVHCNAGMGRTGTVLAAYRLAIGLDKSADEAIRFMRGRRRGSIQTFKQEDCLRDFEAWLGEHGDERQELLEIVVSVGGARG